MPQQRFALPAPQFQRMPAAPPYQAMGWGRMPQTPTPPPAFRGVGGPQPWPQPWGQPALRAVAY
jgi:hypothetical protein